MKLIVEILLKQSQW